MTDVHLCRADEIHAVMGFIERHWAKGHVLARDRALMDWQHKRADGFYNFVVAARAGEDEPLGVLGFIPTSRYDPALAGQETVWLALWKVRPDAGSAGAGLGLLRFLTDMYPGTSVGVVGIGPAQHHGMYRALGFNTGQLSQFYMLAAGKSDFQIAIVPDAHRARAVSSGKARLTRLSSDDLLSLTDRAVPAVTPGRVPRKTALYFWNRFFGHPVYEYHVHLVESRSGSGLVATRIARHGDSCAIRIVDFLGDESIFAEIGPGVQSLLSESGAEYADVWNAGFATAAVERAGFTLLDPEGAVVIPNYFEPFNKSNGHISFAVRGAPPEAMAIFRADGDQDRPNLTILRA